MADAMENTTSGEPAVPRSEGYEVDDRLFRRPVEGEARPGAEPANRPAASAPARPSGAARLMVAGLFVLGMFGGGIIGSITTLALNGGGLGTSPASIQRPLPVNPSQQTAARADSSIATVARDVTPSVVTIRTREGTTPRNQSEGEGSGFFVNTSGHILTNNHVVPGANRITVILADGTQAVGTVVGTDSSTDLAVVKVDLPAGKIVPVPLGDSDQVRPGDTAIAIGAPFGLEHSVTAGIISAVNRNWGKASGRLRGLLQTDAPVNPGNSGGPLLNAAGEVIGINNAIEGPVRGSVGVGFAIPINTAKQLIPQLSQGKTVEHPWMGISGVAITADVAGQFNLTVKEGVLVMEVIADSPAAKAGLQGPPSLDAQAPVAGDIITKVDGKDVKTVQEIASYLDTKRVGDKITVTLLRDGKSRDLAVTLGAWPDNLNR